MKKSLILSAALCLASLFASAENAPTPRRQLAPKPPMGWMTWNLFQGNINEQLIRETAFNQKTGRCGMQQPGKSMRAYQKPYAVRGKGSTSRMFWMPVRYMIMRSKPRP